MPANCSKGSLDLTTSPQSRRDESAADCRCRHALRQQGVTPMPLLRFDLIEGRSESDVRKILDVTHDVLIETLQVPKRDRYQVVHEHKRSRMIVEDTGLGFVRSDHVLLLQI